MRILLLSPYLPHRNVGHGGGVAVRDLLRHLARRHEVLLAALVRPGEPPLVAEVAGLGAEVLPLPYSDRSASGTGRWRVAAGRSLAWVRAAASGYPGYVEKYWSPGLARRLVAAVERFAPQAIQVEYFQLSLYARALGRWRAARPAGGGPPPRLVLNSHELGSLPRRRRAAAARNPLERAWLAHQAARWERLQVAATRWVDATLCVTEQDRQILAALGGERCLTVPLGIDTEAVRPVWAPPPGPPKLLFVGSFGHRPNREAAKFLIDKVWPRIAQYHGSARLVLAGRGSDAFIEALGRMDERVTATGYVEDLTGLFRECHAFVAPLTEGGGIKIKILEAMARGIPVVTTPIGAEGIVASAEDALRVAPPDATFAETMIRALAEPDANRLRAERARQIIEQRFSWSAITERLTEIYEGR